MYYNKYGFPIPHEKTEKEKEEEEYVTQNLNSRGYCVVVEDGKIKDVRDYVPNQHTYQDDMEDGEEIDPKDISFLFEEEARDSMDS